MLRKKYEAVFIQILTCQLSSFFVQNFVQTTSTLCKQRRQLCSNNVNFARTTTTLYEQCSHFVRTTSTLQGQRQLCTNNVHTLYEQRQLCKDNDNFVRTTSTEETRTDYRLTRAAFENCRLFQYGGLYRSQNCHWYNYVDHQDKYFLFT